ncbi:MAG TPA: hypothetical protein VGX03_18630 [Candidatus Binatia bacterium]|jgi:hypothetical protein|nr:hypothetical protein [Candidatus Binatia bacterium]
MRRILGTLLPILILGLCGAVTCFVTGSASAETALASAEGEKDPLHLEVTELKRTSGGTVSLKFTVTNTGDKVVNFGSEYFADSEYMSGGHREDNHTVGGVHLVDAVNKKKYLVVRDKTTSACVCSKQLDKLQPGARLNLWAKFPAPPADVQLISVVVPNFSLMDDLPLGP